MAKYIGKVCDHHPALEGLRYKFERKPESKSPGKFTTVCVGCRQDRNDRWRNVGVKVNPEYPNSITTYQQYLKAHRGKASQKKKHNERMRKARANKRALLTMAPKLRPSAWVLQWLEDHPGGNMTTERLVKHLKDSDPSIQEAKRKAASARVRKYRERKKAGLVVSSSER